jgi:hypothetical protein
MNKASSFSFGRDKHQDRLKLPVHDEDETEVVVVDDDPYRDMNTKPRHNSFDTERVQEASKGLSNTSTANKYGKQETNDYALPVSTRLNVGSSQVSKSLDNGLFSNNDNNNNKEKNSNTMKSTANNVDTNDANDEFGMGGGNAGGSFVPSFLDRGRQGRRRRQLDRPATTGGIDILGGGGGGGVNNDNISNTRGAGGGSKFDELDALLGIGAPVTNTTTVPKVSKFSSLSNLIENK